MSLYRIALGVEYNGTDYHGWQRQAYDDPENPLTIQGHVERALSCVSGLSPAQDRVVVVCAGRTDRGVHALEQVVHFDTAVVRSERSWVLGTNTHLPNDIRIRWAKQVDASFHARYSAISRSYQYVIHHTDVPSALWHPFTTWVRQSLDLDAMRAGAACLLGQHDFSAFRSSQCQSKTPIRCVQHLHLSQAGARVIIDIRANAFLHHMVRNIAGVLIAVGQGKQPPEWVQAVLDSKDRRVGGVTAPPQGLYLTRVQYIDKAFENLV